jgi:hypothetical protein
VSEPANGGSLHFKVAAIGKQLSTASSCAAAFSHTRARMRQASRALVFGTSRDQEIHWLDIALNSSGVRIVVGGLFELRRYGRKRTGIQHNCSDIRSQAERQF